MTAAVREQLRHEIDRRVREQIGDAECECGRCAECHAPIKNGRQTRKRGYRWDR